MSKKSEAGRQYAKDFLKDAFEKSRDVLERAYASSEMTTNSMVIASVLYYMMSECENKLLDMGHSVELQHSAVRQIAKSIREK